MVSMGPRPSSASGIASRKNGVMAVLITASGTAMIANSTSAGADCVCRA